MISRPRNPVLFPRTLVLASVICGPAASLPAQGSAVTANTVTTNTTTNSLLATAPTRTAADDNDRRALQALVVPPAAGATARIAAPAKPTPAQAARERDDHAERWAQVAGMNRQDR